MTTSPGAFVHAVFVTGKYDEMRQWYINFLGAKPSHEDGNLCFLSYDSEHHRIAIARGPPGMKPRGPGTAGLAHIAYSHTSLRQLADAYEERKRVGIRPFWCVNHGVTTSMYYADPDGNQVEVQVDHFPSAADANAYMMSKAFSVNPIGADYDPEEFVRKVRAGVPDAEIMRRPDVGPRDARSVPSPQAARL
ncbi:Glyoxalase/Bleomycin resistance protein/Dihydroxybiphenyl dioxygenase [Hyaloraphidium curvatum]|nr:Glyoxalase/Bleomycin resistance protein/Dihydroxybiphenyl dioxygenase [Hyaloraphidium curvatum]